MKEKELDTTTFRLADTSRIVVDRLGDEIILTENLDLSPDFPKFFRAPITVCIILEEGELFGRINLKDIHVSAPAMIIVFPTDILEYRDRSANVRGKAILMSEHFESELNLKSNFDLQRAIRLHPVVPLDQEALQSLLLYSDLIKRAMSLEDNPNQLEIIVSLTRAMYYGAGYYFHKIEEHTRRTRDEDIVNEFMQLVHQHCRHERRLEFYASKMSLSTKYLTNVISARTNRPASRWIQEHVLLEAKAMLGAPHTTVAQVADALHFPDQSTFGKFFRRHTGLSPKAFQETKKSIRPSGGLGRII
jgi:AraC-like DNA-binding protein